jgi:DNA (cytosine-5)-methyltransferase 1
MSRPRYGELFTGIGGMSLGLERAGWEPAWFAENDAYCSRVLAKHWPDIPNLGDVTAVDWEEVERVDLVCGGYPCPTFSQAARGRNVAVSMWPWMRCAIAALRPRLVLLENVAAHLGRGFSAVLADLHALGFDVEWSTVTACSVGAAHTRRRLFAVAYPHGDREPVFSVDAEMAGLSSVSGSRGHWGVPTADDVRTDDGVPARMDRLRALGNAVVPQVAQFIGERILESLR